MKNANSLALLLGCIVLWGCSRSHYAIVVNCSGDTYKVDTLNSGQVLATSAVGPLKAVRIEDAVYDLRNSKYVFRFSRGKVVEEVVVTGEQLRANEWVVQFCHCGAGK
jgi:hypothetical protein